MGITVHPLLTVMIFFHLLLTNTLAVFVTLLSQTKKIPFEKALTVTSPRNLENSFLLGSIDTSVLLIKHMNSSRVA